VHELRVFRVAFGDIIIVVAHGVTIWGTDLGAPPLCYFRASFRTHGGCAHLLGRGHGLVVRGVAYNHIPRQREGRGGVGVLFRRGHRGGCAHTWWLGSQHCKMGVAGMGTHLDYFRTALSPSCFGFDVWGPCW